MKIAMCIPSRGRPQKLLEAIQSLDRTCAYPAGVVLSVALDDDDEILSKPDTLCDLRWSINTREDTLGAKYNRCAEVDADIYALWVDDVHMATSGWDEQIRNAHKSLPDDGVGLIYYGGWNGLLPNFMAATKQWINEVGFFMPPYFPTWWHETWLDEIGHLTGRIVVNGGIRVTHPEGQGKTIGLREIAFWAKFFDDTRQLRLRAADRILDRYENPLQKQKMLALRPKVVSFLEARNSQLRDPLMAELWEAKGEKAFHDERYRRAKAEALSLVESLHASEKAAS